MDRINFKNLIELSEDIKNNEKKFIINVEVIEDCHASIINSKESGDELIDVFIIDSAKIENSSFVKLIERFINDKNKEYEDCDWDYFIEWLGNLQYHINDVYENFNLRNFNFSNNSLFKVEKLIENESIVLQENNEEIKAEIEIVETNSIDWNITIELKE